QRWAPYAAPAWSLVYAALGLYWAVGGRGFPYAPDIASGVLGPLAGRFGQGAAWTVVIGVGLPAAAVGAAMLRGARVLRPFLIAAGAVLAGVLLLLMTDINLLIQLGYLPYGIVKFLLGAEFGQAYVKSFIQWPLLHQLLCLAGGFLWLGATVSYARRSGDACLYCGRRDGPEGWTSPDLAARWGRIAVYAAMAVPVFYAVTRYAWALGIPLGMSEEALRSGQERGMWISGLSLATFGLVGAVLILGLAQRWGEVFPRWMIGLAGRRVPIGLAVVPAAVMSVLLAVGGLTILSSYGQMSAAAEAAGYSMAVIVGPVALFPFWGAALAAAALGYYYRRRGPCGVCGRGGPRRTGEPLAGRVLPAAG
ncbi:MAG TPA: hypothetical protein VF813_07405, partial [Anaerolineaceae bacterium]